ncbi:MAG TPA: GlsB/YeaQ/YmgE family stress response membrane protein [Nocardioides sp.]|nr:GlsB/YeaQ/YmgE family stress response membrane protein [Nocardioides sp.]
MLILAILAFGILAGGIAQLILGRSMNDIDWTTALVTGLLGSFVGGLLVSLLAGDGLELRPSGLIGSVVGALLVAWLGGLWSRRRHT